MNTSQNGADVQNTLHGYPSRELIRSRSTKWNADDIEYAYSMVDQHTHSSCRILVIKWLDELRVERAQDEADEKSALRHAQILGQLGALKKTHWTVLPNFWLTAISAISAIVAAILAWVALNK